MLRLKPLDLLQADPGAAKRGTIIHQALDEFTRTFPDKLPKTAERHLIEIGERVFKSCLTRPGVQALWWPRFKRIAHWFIANEYDRRNSGFRILATETKGELEITDLNSGSQVVVTIVGRIDIGNIFMLLAPQAAIAIDLQGSAVTRVSAKLISVVQAETNPMTELTQSLDQDISPAAGIPPELQDYLNRLSSEKEVVNSESTLITYPETANLNPDISSFLNFIL